MKRLCFNSKTKTYEWLEWKPSQNSDFGPSCVQKKKYVKDKVRINNQEVQTGNNRTALYTMPDGTDNGVRYSPLYEHSGLDITEIEATKDVMQKALDKVTEAVKEEVKENLKNVPKANVTKDKSEGSESSE